MKPCKTCGETTLETDSSNGEETLVCISCGTVQEEQQLVSDHRCDGDSGLKHYNNKSGGIYLGCNAPKGIQNCSHNERPSEGQKQGYSTLDNLRSVFKLPDYMITDAKALFNQAYSSPQIKFKTISFKKNLAASCAYSVMRKYSLPISINNLCHTVGCYKDELSDTMTVLTKQFNIHFQAPPIEEMLETFLGGMKLEKEKGKIKEKTLELVQLCDECWLVTGRSQRTLILVTTYLAWQYQCPTRKKVTINEFCRLMEMVYTSTLNKTKRLVLRAIKKLADSIPWLEKGKVTEKNLVLFLDDIIRFKRTLIQDTVQRLADSSGTLDSYQVFRQDGVRKTVQPQQINHELSEEIDESEIDSYIRSDKEVHMAQMCRVESQNV